MIYKQKKFPKDVVNLLTQGIRFKECFQLLNNNFPILNRKQIQSDLFDYEYIPNEKLRISNVPYYHSLREFLYDHSKGNYLKEMIVSLGLDISIPMFFDTFMMMFFDEYDFRKIIQTIINIDFPLYDYETKSHNVSHLRFNIKRIYQKFNLKERSNQHYRLTGVENRSVTKDKINSLKKLPPAVMTYITIYTNYFFYVEILNTPIKASMIEYISKQLLYIETPDSYDLERVKEFNSYMKFIKFEYEEDVGVLRSRLNQIFNDAYNYEPLRYYILDGRLNSVITDYELYYYYTPEFFKISTKSNFFFLLNQLENNMVYPWAIRRGGCFNSDLEDINGDKFERNEPTLAYYFEEDDFIYWRCYPLSSLIDSFHLQPDGTYVYYVPDYQNPENNPHPSSNPKKYFNSRDLITLKLFIQNLLTIYQVHFEVKSQLRELEFKLDSIDLEFDLYSNVKEEYSSLSPENQAYFQKYLAWLFFLSQWIKQWKGPQEPFPSQSLNVNNCNPNLRGSNIKRSYFLRSYLQLPDEVYNLISSLKTVYLANGIPELTPSNLEEQIENGVRGDLCHGLLGDEIYLTSYYLIKEVLQIDVNVFIRYWWPVIRQMELSGGQDDNFLTYLNETEKEYNQSTLELIENHPNLQHEFTFNRGNFTGHVDDF